MTPEIMISRGEALVRASARVEIYPEGSDAARALPMGALVPGGSHRETLFSLGAGTVAEETGACEGLRVARETFRPEGGRPVLAVRLRVTNTGDTPVRVATLSPLVVAGEGLRLGGREAGEWVYLRQPRHKNDMPAAVVLGGDSAGLRDAVRGTPETGGVPRGGDGERPMRFVSSELTTLRGGEDAVLFGFFPLDQQLVQTELTLTPDRRALAGFRADCQCDGQRLDPGETLCSQWVLVDLDPDTAAATERYAELLLASHSGARERRQAAGRPPTVWCSWYYYGDGFTQAEAEANLEALARRPLPIDVFQIDECWDQEWGDWVPNNRWPGVAEFPAKVRAAGYRPGIWTCPLLADIRATTRFQHPDWLLRRRDGRHVDFPMGRTVSYVLDPTHPEVLQFLEDLYRRLTHEWGYTYHKLDFTRAIGDPEAVFHDRTKNRAQAYRMALEAVRRGAGPEAYINVCGGFYGPLIGIADAQRTGSDVKSIWPQAPEGEEAEGYGPFTIKQNALRGWMNRLWDNDPDALMVRRRPEAYREEDLSLGLLNDDEALTCALNQYLGGGLVCFSENLGEIEEDRLLLLRHCAPSVGAAAIARDAREGARFPHLLDTRVTPAAEGLPVWHTLSVINWHAETRKFLVTLDEESLGEFAREQEAFVVSAFRGRWMQPARVGDTIEVGPIPAHGCEVLKVQPFPEGEPCLVRTTGHFSMGGTEITAWEPYADGLRLQVRWPWAAPLEMVIAPAWGRTFADTPRGGAQLVRVEGPVAGTVEFDLKYL